MRAVILIYDNIIANNYLALNQKSTGNTIMKFCFLLIKINNQINIFYMKEELVSFLYYPHRIMHIKIFLFILNTL